MECSYIGRKNKITILCLLWRADMVMKCPNCGRKIGITKTGYYHCDYCHDRPVQCLFIEIPVVDENE